MRIRSRLLLLVSAVLVPALVAAAVAIGYLYREEEAFNRASIAETARALALAVDRDLTRRESILRTLAGSPSVQRGELQRFYGFAAAVAAEHDVAIILSDLEGRQLLNTRRPFGTPLPPMLPAERENRARYGDDATIISDLYLPPANLGPHSFAIQIPVRRDGKVIAFLTMASFANQLEAMLMQQRLPAGWHATIVDRRNVVVARSVDAEKFVGRPVRSDLAAKISERTEGFHEGQNLAGQPSTAFFSRAPNSAWTLLLAVQHSALHGAPRRAVAILGAVSLVLLGAGLAAAMLVARRISRPVESLREAAHALGENRPARPAPAGIVELDEVAEAMARAGERLRGTTAELERRVAEAVASFERSQKALVQAQKLDALGRLTGGIAHDFNNVLQTLTATLEAVKIGAGAEQRELIARCQRAVARGTELARQLMAFGRMQELRAQAIDPQARLAEARPLFAGALPANVRLDYELAPRLWPVMADPAQLELALLNLVINARDALPRGGRIVLRGRNETLAGRGDLQQGEYVVFSVVDDGEGMSEEVLARALDPFYTTKGVGKGSGMGLPQAYGFARQNGGSLWLESRLGHGTTVTLALPRARQPVAEETSAHASSGAPAGRGKVLFVEDDAEVRETVAAALRGAGFEVHPASTGDEALARLGQGERFDAVLTDVVMPGRVSGIELAEHVRRSQPRTGVVVATGYSDRLVHLPGVRALSKPYDLRQAVEALNAAIGA